MSDLKPDTRCFLELYDQGLASAAALDDHVAAWHDSSAEETRSLAEYLGLTEAEYAAIGMAPDALPLIVQARREKVSLRSLLSSYRDALRDSGDPSGRPVVHALTHYLTKPDAV